LSISAIASPAPFALSRGGAGLRFGRETEAAGRPGLLWMLARQASAPSRRMWLGFAVVGGVSLAIATAFWLQGATLVLPFAWLEVAALAGAAWAHARHAGDRECIRLEADRLTVEHACGARTERVEFASAWVRVEPVAGDRSLVELSGQGQRIEVGRYVRPELRRQLAEELRWALRHWPLAGVRRAD